MSESQLRVKLLVAAGIVGASLLGASFVGCSSGPPSPSSAPFASYNGSPMAPGGGMPGGPVAAPGVDGYSQQNRQAFMAETQRMGGQQNLTAQDVVAMSRSGMPDTQIAMAIQQRGASLRATPGADRYLAANGVNPAVLGGSNPASPYPVYPANSRWLPHQRNSRAILRRGCNSPRRVRVRVCRLSTRECNSRRSARAAIRAFNRPRTRCLLVCRAPMRPPQPEANLGVPWPIDLALGARIFSAIDLPVGRAGQTDLGSNRSG